MSEAYTMVKNDRFLKDTGWYLEAGRLLISADWSRLPFEVEAYTAMCRQ